VESIIERINQHKFWQFHGGIHPPEQKALTSGKPIRQLALPKQLILPLQQHIGRQGDLLVKVGDKVLKGQALTQSTNPMAVPIHAPTSGIVSAIKKSVIAHPSGLSELCIFIDVDFEDTWQPREICQDFSKLSQQQIIKKIADSGIAGMGGAGFPTHIKVNTKPDINFLIINAAECEPYITADDLLMCEQSEAIIDGIKILDILLKPAFILIGIEDNKPKAIKALQYATKDIEKINVCVLPTKYPTGGEKQLIKVLTGKEVKSGNLPIHTGIVVQNVATCFAISDAVIHDIPLIKRVVTLTGQSLSKPQNVWVLLGTPVSHVLEQAGFTSEVAPVPNTPVSNPPVIMGGPLMGFNILNEQVPIVKTSNCILAPSKTEMPSAFDNSSNEVECIRCGQCSDVCPSQLLPQELQWSAKAKDHQQLTKLNIFDCIDCGACAYVCPSQIPLVQYYRIAKAEIRQQQQLDIKSEKAKVRFEARKLRLEKDKISREEKHKKAAAARKATMNKKTAEGGSATSAVAAALARVKAKKKAKENSNDLAVMVDEKTVSKSIVTSSEVAENTNGNDESGEKSQVKAAIARAKAKRLAKKNEVSEGKVTNSEEKKTSDELRVSSSEETKASDELRVSSSEEAETSDGLAVASNEKAEASDELRVSSSEEAEANDELRVSSSEETETSDGLTVASNEESNHETKPNNSADDKKAKIAVAIAKAKAKAKAKTKTKKEKKEPLPTSDNKKTNITTAGTDDKKARIAAAVAKAKTKAKAKAKKEHEKQEGLLRVASSEEKTSFKPSNEESE